MTKKILIRLLNKIFKNVGRNEKQGFLKLPKLPKLPKWW